MRRHLRFTEVHDGGKLADDSGLQNSQSLRFHQSWSDSSDVGLQFQLQPAFAQEGGTANPSDRD